MPLESYTTQTGCRHTPFSQRNSPAFPFCILINLPSVLVSLPLFLSCEVPVGPSDSMAAWPLPYSGCHAQVITPHNEDICATLINEPVVVASQALPSLPLMSLLKFRLWSSTSSTAWRLPLHCSSFQIVDFALWLHSPNQVLTVNLT